MDIGRIDLKYYFRINYSEKYFMKTIYILFFIAITVLLSSCHGKRLSVKNFAPINNFSELNGRYINKDDSLSKLLKIYPYNSQMSIDVMGLEFVDKDSLIVSYADTVGYKRLALKGKKKENFFEIYFENTRIYLPPVFVTNQIDRVRIGKDKHDKLLVYKWDEHYGMIIPLGAGGAAGDEYQVSFERYNKKSKEGLYATRIDGKWGYTDKEDNVVIEPTYDYANPFNNGIAKVVRNNRWGFIDTNNVEIVPLVYDVILKSEDGLLPVYKDGKWGLIDSLNNQIVVPQYDFLSSFGRWKYRESSFSDLAEVHKDGKIGFIDRQGIEVIPPEYDEIEMFSTDGKGYSEYCRTRLGDKYGYANGNGVFCKPVFTKAGKNISYNGFSPKNQTLVEHIGKYTEVVYNGEPYLFTENRMLYKYKKLGFFKENRLVVDFDSGFYLDE